MFMKVYYKLLLHCCSIADLLLQLHVRQCKYQGSWTWWKVPYIGFISLVRTMICAWSPWRVLWTCGGDTILCMRLLIDDSWFPFWLVVLGRPHPSVISANCKELASSKPYIRLTSLTALKVIIIIINAYVYLSTGLLLLVCVNVTLLELYCETVGNRASLCCLSSPFPADWATETPSLIG